MEEEQLLLRADAAVISLLGLRTERRVTRSDRDRTSERGSGDVFSRGKNGHHDKRTQAKQGRTEQQSQPVRPSLARIRPCLWACEGLK